MGAWNQSATADPRIIEAVEITRAKATLAEQQATIATDAAERAEAAAALSGSGSAEVAAQHAAAAHEDRLAADAAQAAAGQSAAAAEAGRVAAETSATAAGESATAAAQSATAAGTDATAASTSATASAQSAAAAGQSAVDADQSATAAHADRLAAASDATAAAGSATSAAQSAASAGQSATAAHADRLAADASATAADGSATAAAGSATAAAQSVTEIGGNADAAAQSATAAGASATAAHTDRLAADASATAAGGSATSAAQSATNAGQSATAAHADRLAADASATAADGSATAAAGSATAAAQSATAAHTDRLAADASATAAAGSAAAASGSATSIAQSATAADQSAADAEQSATAAHADRLAADASATAAHTDRLAADASAAAAAGSATSAAQNATATGQSATAAAQSATSAHADRLAADASATAAAGSATAAAQSATTAGQSATAAGQSATGAAQSATAAHTDRLAADASATAAEASATGADQSATDAGASATAAHADRLAADASATAASGSATAASQSATNAAQSATAAAGSATAAHSDRLAADASVTAAGGSATAASQSATNAAQSATTAGASATTAHADRLAADASAAAAGGSATAAAQSATNASQSATAAAQSATSAGQSATAAGQSATAAHSDRLAADASAAAADADRALAATSATAAHDDRLAADASAAAAAQSALAATAAAVDAAGYRGGWDADANVPPIVSGVGSNGDWYEAIKAGGASIDGNNAWAVGDKIRFSSAKGEWERVPNETGFVPDFAPDDDEHGADYVGADIDADGRAMAGVDARGRLFYREATIRPSEEPDDEAGDIVFARTMDGMLAGFNLRTGRMVVVGVEIGMAAGDDERRLLPVVEALDGIPIGIDNEGGTVLKLGRRAETWMDPRKLMPDLPGVFGVRADGERGLVAMQQDSDGYTGDIYKQLGIPSRSAIRLEDRIGVNLCICQSNGSGSSGKPGGPLWKKNSYPHDVLMLPNSLMHDGRLLWSGYAIPSDDFVPLEQLDGFGQTPLATMAEALVALERRAGERSPARVCNVSWKGGEPLEHFFPGTPDIYTHENAVEMLQRTRVAAARYPLPLVFEMLLVIQGEDASAQPWGNLLGSFIDTVLPIYVAALGVPEPPRVAYFQTNTADNVGSSNGNELEQLRVALERDSPAVSLIGPMYQFRLYDGDPTTHIHLDDIGRLRFSELAAIVHNRVVRQGLPWNPLKPDYDYAARVDNIITIPLIAPPECVGPLRFDTDYVALSGVTNKGFVFEQVGGNTPSIVGVEISGAALIITLSETPTGAGQALAYAIKNNAFTTGWPTGRGLVYTEDPRTSVWFLRGVDDQEHPRHYLVRCRVPVSEVEFNFADVRFTFDSNATWDAQ